MSVCTRSSQVRLTEGEPMADDEFEPCELGELDGEYYISFNDFNANDADLIFEEAGYDGGGYAWHGAVEALVKMRAPKLRRKLEYDPEASLLQISSTDRDALRQVAALIREAIADPALLRKAISKADPEIMD